MRKDKEDREYKEGEELIPEVEPRREMPPEKKEIDPLPDKELEYDENTNEKYRDES